MIDLTPLEVRKKKGDFRRTMRGYDPSLVDDFLDLAADRMEELVRENMSLTERLGRQEQQVTEFRERERALTEALVTAQEMREEIRRQSTREAELAMKAAEQETRQLRVSAEQESAKLRSDAQQEAARVRAEVELLREREESAVQRLRARQRQFLGSYRAFLERELTELSVVTRTLGLAGAAAASEPSPDVKLPPARTPSAPPTAPAAAPPVAAEPLDALLDPSFGGLDDPDPDAIDLAADHHGFDDVSPAETAIDDGMLGDVEVISNADSGDVGLVAAEPDSDMEPFEPEPFEPEPFEPDDEAGGSDDAVHGHTGYVEAAEDHATEDEVDVLELTEIDDDDPSRGAPLGLTFIDDDSYELEHDDVADENDDGDEETTLLLRNAAAAGYRLPDEDELLLEDAIDNDDGEGDVDADDDEDDDDQTWLPTLLEDPK